MAIDILWVTHKVLGSYISFVGNSNTEHIFNYGPFHLTSSKRRKSQILDQRTSPYAVLNKAPFCPWTWATTNKVRNYIRLLKSYFEAPAGGISNIKIMSDAAMDAWNPVCSSILGIWVYGMIGLDKLS